MDESCTDLTETDRHQLNHKELYLSRQLDTLPATHIRHVIKFMLGLLQFVINPLGLI